MSDLHPLDPRLADLERRLSELSPREARLSVGETLFRAGQASVRHDSPRGRALWPLATTVSVLIAVALAVLLSRRPNERVVYVERSPVPADATVTRSSQVKTTPNIVPTSADRVWLGAAGNPLWSADSSYIRARQLALRFGVESLPTTRTSFGNDADGRWLRYADWRQGLERINLTFNDPLPTPSMRTPGASLDSRGGS